ncbi:ubiquitin domain-containing protein 1 [Thecamonas trahens ATCC 50062]|uniref:Ubiquitin domain-containing protein 1 n=1 Tax=Thecamonas trahens ATCC 50062 TaxID=461836 RepID=A0A0L0D9D6_THETB|nr:ubiquitin domain-containing protein 1 [Thecamonas trahens ATCC 50062]KNC48954.1 ubiquitin domain-containing protein 1 [Thecamonas trahens ATCC 50062]|eukprot:XP_013758371.1 ubiquitin domain-containing protein 1 [Thecamonas trahens ATCC 50062]
MGCSQSSAAGSSGPLTGVVPKWKSDEPMTKDDLARKREEFWDTAPYYGGNEECWAALKSAVEAPSRSAANDILLAAAITVPSGVLTESYDRLGYKYEIPLYCLKEPSNMVS